MPAWRRFIIEYTKDIENHRTSQFILCDEHFQMLFRLIFCVGFCMRPADYLAIVSAEIHVKAEDNLTTPARKWSSVFGKIVWEADWLRRGRAIVPGVLPDYGCVPSEGFVSFSDVWQSG